MGNVLREWLGPLLKAELNAALDWKRALANTPRKPSHGNHSDDDDDDLDLKFSLNGDDITISVTRPVAGDNSYVQITQVSNKA